MTDLEKEIFNQFFLDYLEKEMLTPKLGSNEVLDTPPSRLGFPGTLGIIKTVKSSLIADNVNEKEDEAHFKAHTFFQLNFKIKEAQAIPIKFDLSFVLYVKNFPTFTQLSIVNSNKYLNKNLRDKKREFAKEISKKNPDLSYEDKETIIMDELKVHINNKNNPNNHAGLGLVIDKILTLLKRNITPKTSPIEIAEEQVEVEDIDSDDESDENQFLINKSLFHDNNLTDDIYKETIEMLSKNDSQLYKVFFNEITPNYTYSPIEVKINNFEVSIDPYINEASEANNILNKKLIKCIEREIFNQITINKINININKKLSLFNFINKENYLDFINNHNEKHVNNILIYYPKIKLVRNKEHFRIIATGCDYVANDIIKSIALFDERLFNTELKISFNKKHLTAFNYSNTKSEKEHYKYQNSKPIYCQSNHIATCFEDAELLQIKTTWNPKYYLPRNENTGINTDLEKDKKLFSYTTWFSSNIIDFSIMEEIPKKYKEWVLNIKLNNEIKTSQHFKNDLKKWNKEIENISLGIELLKISYQNISSPEVSPIINSWQYLNETFSLIDPKYTQWRLFQLCFVLSLIPSIVLKNPKTLQFIEKNSSYDTKHLDSVVSDAQDNVNLLFFTAGGGKTEGFLSVIIYTMFFERLTGITHGLTAILKYPLRLLLTQQTNRVLKAICAAEKVRAKIKLTKTEDLFDSTFSLGIWVGSSSTPNIIDKEVKDLVLEIENEDILNFGQYDLLWENNLLKKLYEIHNDAEHIEKTSAFSYIEDFNKNGSCKWDSFNGFEGLTKFFNPHEKKYQKIEMCPFCNSLDITLKIVKKTLFHFCLNKKCHWNTGQRYKGLPFYIVDENVYERNPTVIISTTDKLSKMGYITKTNSAFPKKNEKILPDNRKVLGIFGIAPYFNKTEKIYTWAKTNKDTNTIDLFKSNEKIIKFPSWIIQDETHLLIESLGSFSAIFERNFTYTLLEIKKIFPSYIMSNGLPYIIASTATMASPEKQLLPIYGKKNICLFPSTGYRLYENFYSKPKEKDTVVDSFEEYEKYAISRIYNGYILNEVVYFKTANNICLLHHQKLQDLWNIGITKNEFISNIKNNYYKNLAIQTFNDEFNFNEFIKRNVLYTKILINYTGNKNTNEKLKKWENDICTLDGKFKDTINADNQVSITSDVTITDLSAILEKIEKESSDFDKEELRVLRSIFATQSISHGVDSAQFNAMVFHGVPEFINEYIQASARIGRTNIGYVTVLPLKNNKDKLIMSNFENFHRFIERPVLANTIDFQTQTIVEKTLPSLFISWYINVYKLKLGSLGAIVLDDFHEDDVYNEFIYFVKQMLGLSASFNISFKKLFSEEDSKNLKEILENQWGNLMTSLRDTEKSAKIIIGEKNDRKK